MLTSLSALTSSFLPSDCKQLTVGQQRTDGPRHPQDKAAQGSSQGPPTLSFCVFAKWEEAGRGWEGLGHGPSGDSSHVQSQRERGRERPVYLGKKGQHPSLRRPPGATTEPSGASGCASVN